MKRMVGIGLGAFSLFVVFVVIAAVPAGADVISPNSILFSGPVISDNDAPYTVFDGFVDYLYASNVLTLHFHNDTAAPSAYTLSEFCFNVSDDVTGMSILNDGALTNTSLGINQHGGPFGVFECDFDLGRGNDGILAGGSETVTFAVSGSNLDIDDFLSHVSSGNAGLGNQLATIHFTRGPGGDSAWVTPRDPAVPEPASMSLLGLGLGGLLVRRLRKS